jgi:hypothetical protein
MTVFFNFPAFGSLLSASPADKRRGFGITPALKCGALLRVAGNAAKHSPRLTAWCFLWTCAFFLVSCSSEAQTLPWVERQRLIARYHDRLTPVQQQKFLSQNFENSQAAEAALNSYLEKNRSDAQLLQQRTVKMREIAEAWRCAEKFVESVNTYLSEKKGSAEDLKRKSELERQYVEVTNQLTNAQDTIHHTPFESGQKREFLQQNSAYRKRVEEAMKRVSEK